MGELLLRGLTMSNEWGAFERIRLGSNGPLWSLSYEAAFYILFAIAFFLKGARRAAFICIAAWIIGPRVLMLMPAWLMGVALWRWIARGGAQGLPRGLAHLCAWAGPILYVASLSIGLPDKLAALTAAAFEPHHYRLVLAFSDEFIWNAVIGLMTALHIIGMAGLLKEYQGTHPRIRWWAGASFSIYVTHYPALHLIDAAFPAQTLARDGLFVLGSILIGLLFAQVFERPIGKLRQGLKNAGVFPSKTAAQTA